MILDLPKVGIVPLFGAVHSASRRISHSQHDETCLVGHLRRNKYHINGRFWRALDWRHFFPPAAGAAEAKATPSSIAPPWHAVLIAAVATTISFQFSSPHQPTEPPTLSLSYPQCRTPISLAQFLSIGRQMRAQKLSLLCLNVKYCLVLDAG